MDCERRRCNAGVDRGHGAALGVHSGSGGRAYFKYGPIRGKARVRLFLRRHVFRVAYPPLAEMANLTWLREHDFGAPEPRLAGMVLTHGLPAFRFLYTRELFGQVTMQRFLTEQPAASRRKALLGLAHGVARLHGLGFIHRDLFARNVLVDPRDPGRPSFLDAWRGGPGPDARGPLYDLACFDLDAQALLEPREREAFLDAYEEARERLGKPVRRKRLGALVSRRRLKLAKRRAAG